jgi:hypothetical protein
MPSNKYRFLSVVQPDRTAIDGLFAAVPFTAQA